MQQNKQLSALPFITFSESLGYRIHEESLQALQKLPLNSKCSVLSVVGRAKTGKSYLFNQLLPLLSPQSIPRHQCFPVFDGIGPGTSGIIMVPIQVQGKIVILLDMEGLGNISNRNSNEEKLFAITLLLSSIMVYNNTGPLDLQALQGLGILAELGKLISSTLSNPSRKRLQPPSLIVTLRDFALSLETTEGDPITPQKYLENALQEQMGTSKSIINKNSIKKVLKAVFSSRNCFTLSLPSEQLPLTFDSQLRKQFKEEILNFAANVKEQLTIRPKALNGKELSAQEWIDFAKDIVQAVNIEDKGNLKLQGLLFQAYRRQQSSVRDNFSLKAQALLKKAEVKSERIMNIIQLVGEVDQIHLKESAQRGQNDLKMFQQQLNNFYLSACFQIEQMVKKQGGTELSESSLDYSHPSIAKIKDFSELFDLKSEKTSKIVALRENIQSALKQHLRHIQLKQMQRIENSQFTLIIQELGLSKTERQVDQKYIHFMKNLKSQQMHLEPKVLQTNLLKLEVSYLRRKLECSGRQARQSEKEQAQQRPPLQQRSVQLERTQKCKEHPTSNQKMYTFYSKCSRQVTPFNGYDNKRPFLVPYLTFSEDQVNFQILRTLVRQDNRSNYYVQYVLEVELIDRRWTFNRRWKDFNQLHNILSHLFPPHYLPPFSPGKMALQCELMGRQEEIEARRSRLQSYSRQLLQLDEVRNSRIMQKFLKVNKEYVPFL